MASPGLAVAAIAIALTGGAIMLFDGQRALAHDAAEDRQEARSLLFDEAKALKYSQKAIGRRVGDHRFLTSRGEMFQLSSTRGKPLIVNLVYTSCSDACPLTVQTLLRAADVVASAVGPDSFTIITVGFDSRADTPLRMHDFARAQGIDRRNWRVLSADQATIDRLTAELGFIYAPAAGGFDHLSQTSVIDAEGRVYRQIYGTTFAAQALAEPLKQLVFGGETSPVSFSGLLDRVKLLCTVYDPTSGRYRFSYAIFIEIVVGALSLGAVGFFLLRLWLQTRRPLARRS
jgi:protein SCO1